MAGLLAQRAALQSRAQARTDAEALLNREAAYVDGVAQGDPAIIKEADLDTSEPSGKPIGLLPKVTRLVAARGDTDGELDAHWDPVKRGLLNYTVEITEDATGQTGWR